MKMAQKIALVVTKEEKQLIVDAVRVYVAMVTEEYHNKPTLEGANKMGKAINFLDRIK
jgi:hypothetical protein